MLTVVINWPDNTSEVYSATHVRYNLEDSLEIYGHRGDGLPDVTICTNPDAYYEANESPPQALVFDGNRNIVASYIL